MSNEIELITDDEGIAVIGESSAVERFLSSANLPSRDLGLHERLGSALSTGAGLAQAGSELAATSGRWVKLTEKSAQAMKTGQLMTGSSSDVARAIVVDKGKQTKHILEIVKTTTPTSMLTNPAILAGAAGIMAQLAMQQTMDEITDYLAVIDEKVSDVLRAQRDAALAQLVGVGSVIDEAMTIREHTGRVSETTWSKIQATSLTVAQAQSYALFQLDALAQKMEKKKQAPDLAKVTKEAEEKVGEWLAVLARCFQLQDAIAVLELDRVLDASPDELDRHRIALQAARSHRREAIGRSTERLMARMDAASVTADAQVLLHPIASHAVTRSSNQVGDGVVAFHARLGIDSDRQALEAKAWVAAATDMKDLALETGVDGVEAARRFGVKTLGSARTAASNVGGGLTQRLARRRKDEDPEPVD
ncbi:rRNA processing protein Krr1/Pno1 [Friedmanniella endophytica]|uniref:rRNA processing protein Krr1/Pno1 n=1 Tax=Microlunatus kandeliicorticis TaxID=1759536 RepID=A0A7W3IPK0_9ACTN|nr:hypothetical protein [Microlunatus kandeliicorticis]MBA8792865.1 rRNA processing protein Krr1/Pno1 [Microlunatus kandeliicorticis]